MVTAEVLMAATVEEVLPPETSVSATNEPVAGPPESIWRMGVWAVVVTVTEAVPLAAPTWACTVLGPAEPGAVYFPVESMDPPPEVTDQVIVGEADPLHDGVVAPVRVHVGAERRAQHLGIVRVGDDDVRALGRDPLRRDAAIDEREVMAALDHERRRRRRDQSGATDEQHSHGQASTGWVAFARSKRFDV